MHAPEPDNDAFAARQPCVVLASKFMWAKIFVIFFFQVACNSTLKRNKWGWLI